MSSEENKNTTPAKTDNTPTPNTETTTINTPISIPSTKINTNTNAVLPKPLSIENPSHLPSDIELEKEITRISLSILFETYCDKETHTLSIQNLKIFITDLYKNYKQNYSSDLSESDLKEIDLLYNDILSKSNINNTEKGTDTIKMSQIDDYFFFNQTKYKVKLIDLDSGRAFLYLNRFLVVLRKLPIIIQKARSLAYASEMGESVRPIVGTNFVRFTYGLSWMYIFVDTILCSKENKPYGSEAVKYSVLDRLLFHSLASMTLPALVIHSIVKYSCKFVAKTRIRGTRFERYFPTLIGLSSIGFICHPIDHVTDFGLNYTVRTMYKDKLTKPYINKHHIA